MIGADDGFPLGDTIVEARARLQAFGFTINEPAKLCETVDQALAQAGLLDGVQESLHGLLP